MIKRIFIYYFLVFAVIVGSSSLYANPVFNENQLSGTTTWELSQPALNREIEGYASSTSINTGETISFYVNTSAPTYDLEVFRMGWYGGLGGRQVLTSVTLPGIAQTIPTPDSDGLVNCDWVSPYTVTARDSVTGNNWISGVYLAKLTANDSGAESYIIFVVRDDSRSADIAFQLPVTTYQAYNFWGGRSTYSWGSGNGLPWGSTPGTAAKKVSFNRPYARSTNDAAAFGVGAGEFFTNNQPVAQGYPISSAGWDYNMLRWLEREGYDVSYITNIDTHNRPSVLSNYKAFLSVGHDEYWSWEMRENIENARDVGLNLGFFAANVMYFQIRLANDPIDSAENRIIEIYKDQNSDPLINDGNPDNDNLVTTLWRSTLIGLSEDALIGVRYFHDPVDSDIIISNAAHPIFANTGLNNGDRLVGLLGYEVDGRAGNEPNNTVTLAASPAAGGTSHVTIYTAPSGAKVFATGSMAWSWGLDDFGSPQLRNARLNVAAQKITHNVLSEFGAVAANISPFAVADNFSTLPGTVLSLPAPGVLSNDSDRGALTSVLQATTNHGTLILNTDGSLEYTPNAGFTGVDSFTYVASDGILQSPPAEVNISVSDWSSSITLNDNDSRIIKSGGWFTGGSRNAGDYQDDVSYTLNNGSAMEFAFSGTEISLIGPKDNSNNSAEVYIDGASQGIINDHSATNQYQPQQVLFAISGLSRGPHTFKMVKRSGSYMQFDAIKYNEANEVSTGTVGNVVKLDFASHGDAAGGSLSDWNQIVRFGNLQIPSGSVIRHGDGAVASGVSISTSNIISNNFNDDSNAGSWAGTATDPYYILAADDIYFHGTTPATITFGGLNPNSSYNVRIYALIGDNPNTLDTFSVSGDRTLSTSSYRRTRWSAANLEQSDMVFSNMSVNASNQIVVTIPGGYYPLNAIVLEEILP